MQKIDISCKACGFVGSSITHDEELDAEALAGEDEEEIEDCPRCGAKLQAVGEPSRPAGEPKNTGVTTFNGSEESLDEEDK